MTRSLLLTVLAALTAGPLATDPNDVALFDGTSLEAWRPVPCPGAGPVALRAGVLSLGAGAPLTAIAWTGPVARRDYEVTLQARRVAGSDFFCALTVPVADAYVTLVCGGWGGPLVGLSCVDYYDADDNETGTGYDFDLGRWYRIRLRVTAGLIEAWIDDDRVVSLETADRVFSLRTEVEACRPLGIATWNTAAELRDIHLRRLQPKPRYRLTPTYHQATRQGWRLFVSPDLDGERAERVLAQVDAQLRRIAAVVPAGARGALRAVPIWVEAEDWPQACTTYFPDANALVPHGLNPDKAHAVEIAHAAAFEVAAVTDPWRLLHELAHAYHDRVLGCAHPAFREAYRAACRSGHYDHVRHISGDVRRHPAKNSVTEYVAQGTVAFFGVNAYAPRTRAELARVDPVLHDLLAAAYGVTPPDVPPASAP